MLDVQRILCPIDFSDTSRHAFAHAVTVGQWYGARITALHVVRPMIAVSPGLWSTGPMSEIWPGQPNQQELEAQARTWLAAEPGTRLETDVIIDDGRPATSILEHAASLSAGLIVMGTHGRGGFERLLLGSVAEKVLRRATCPVMTVPPPAVTTSKLPFARLLCAVDFSDSSISALQFAFSLAQESNAHLTLVHVFESPSDEEFAKRALATSEFYRQWETDTRQRLDALIPQDVRTWCTPEPILAYGKAYQQILKLAATEQSDLIVMGVQGRIAFDLMLFGSTTNQVVRRASCPVLTLRS